MQQTAVSTMKALVVDDYGPPQNARLTDVAIPTVKDGFLLVRLRAAGVNPFDYAIVTGFVKEWMPATFPYVPGMDGAGEVVDVGRGVDGWTKGDAIIGMFPSGTFAEYAQISAAEKRLARKPEGLDFEHAAALPEAGLTALTMVRTVGVRQGQSALVVGATGGLGLFAVQLLKSLGARVIATGGPADTEYLRALGADDVIDYTSGDTNAQLHRRYPEGVDAVLDVVSRGDALLADAQILRQGGILVSSLEGPDQSAFANDIRVHYIQLTAQPGDLADLAQRAADGELRIEVAAEYELAQAAQAMADLMDHAKHTRGKLVVRIPK